VVAEVECKNLCIVLFPRENALHKGHCYKNTITSSFPLNIYVTKKMKKLKYRHIKFQYIRHFFVEKVLELRYSLTLFVEWLSLQQSLTFFCKSRISI
jgi:hypothetical protein